MNQNDAKTVALTALGAGLATVLCLAVVRDSSASVATRAIDVIVVLLIVVGLVVTHIRQARRTAELEERHARFLERMQTLTGETQNAPAEAEARR